MADFHCIECGSKAPELYKDYRAGIIKISHCTKCGKVVDKYIEHDAVLIFLDALLHKPQAYRHLLYNIVIQSSWKLLLIYLLCDAYLKWDNLHNNKTEVPPEEQLFYAALEWDFYCMFFHAVIEMGSFCISLLFVMKMKILLTKTSSQVNLSFGKLLAIPAIIWGQTHSAIYLTLTRIFIFTSNMTAIKVRYPCSRVQNVLIVGLAHLTQYSIGYILQKVYNYGLI